ncbi:MAG TPA: hypothetical protein VJR05_11145 [Acidimicrobiia bacterium]|nr:hypothetical protein [Acidimicrobiia bacterium]
MTKPDTAFEWLRRANPEPDPDALLALLDDPAPSAPWLQDSVSRPRVMPPTRQRQLGWVAALTVFIVGLVLGAGLLAITNRTGPVGWLRLAPVEVAESYLQALNTWDTEAAKNLVAADARLMDPYWTADAMAGVPWLADLAALFDYHRIIEMRYNASDCQELGRDEPVLVVCEYQADSVFQQVAGAPPLPGRFFFSVADGVIVTGSDNFPIIEYAASWNKWRRWLADNHPEDYELLAGAPTGEALQFWRSRPSAEELTPEWLALLEERIAEYASK